MMKFKSVLSLSLTAAFALSLAACSNSAPNTPAPTPSASASAAPSGSAAPTQAATASASPSAVDELSEAKKAFPNLKVTDGKTNQDDVLLASYGALRYVNNIFNSGYLANGSWAKNGASLQQIDQIYSKDWSDAFRAKMDGAISDYKDAAPDKVADAQTTLMNYMFFTDSNMGDFKFPDDCNQNTVGAASCLKGGQPSIDKEITYQVNYDTGSIYVNIAFTDNVRIIKDGGSGIMPVHYDLQLDMVKNKYPDVQNQRYTYVVNDLGGSWNTDSWQKGE